MCARFHICFMHFSEFLSRGPLSLRAIKQISGSQTAFISGQYSQINGCFQKFTVMSPVPRSPVWCCFCYPGPAFSFNSPISFTEAWLFLSLLWKVKSMLINCCGCSSCFLNTQGYCPDLLEEKTPEMLYTDPCIFNTVCTHEGNRLNKALESWGIIHTKTFCLYLPWWPLLNEYATSPFLRGVPVMRQEQMLSCLPVTEALHGASLEIPNGVGKALVLCLSSSVSKDS